MILDGVDSARADVEEAARMVRVAATAATIAFVLISMVAVAALVRIPGGGKSHA